MGDAEVSAALSRRVMGGAEIASVGPQFRRRRGLTGRTEEVADCCRMLLPFAD